MRPEHAGSRARALRAWTALLVGAVLFAAGCRKGTVHAERPLYSLDFDKWENAVQALGATMVPQDAELLRREQEKAERERHAAAAVAEQCAAALQALSAPKRERLEVGQLDFGSSSPYGAQAMARADLAAGRANLLVARGQVSGSLSIRTPAGVLPEKLDILSDGARYVLLSPMIEKLLEEQYGLTVLRLDGATADFLSAYNKVSWEAITRKHGGDVLETVLKDYVKKNSPPPPEAPKREPAPGSAGADAAGRQ